MIGKRYIDADKLIERLETEARESPITPDFVASLLKRQRRAPQLLSRQGLAAFLGIEPPHVSRYKDRLPEPLDVEGSSWPVWLKDDPQLQALAKELKAERKAKRNSHPAAH